MRLSTKGEYGSVRSIAENTGISEGYLEQLLFSLHRTGIVTSVSGSRGGSHVLYLMLSRKKQNSH